MAELAEVGIARYKPFEVLAEQFSVVSSMKKHIRSNSGCNYSPL
jgi:hypothetical protein